MAKIVYNKGGKQEDDKILLPPSLTNTTPTTSANNNANYFYNQQKKVQSDNLSRSLANATSVTPTVAPTVTPTETTVETPAETPAEPEKVETPVQNIIQTPVQTENKYNEILDDVAQTYASNTSNAPTYDDKYAASTAAAVESIRNMTYENWAKSATYQDLVNRYGNAGNLAMQDTMGQASARTGGMASSYATSAGQQAYNQYMQALDDAARSQYETDLAKMQNDVSNYSSLQSSDLAKAQYDYNVYASDRDYNDQKLATMLDYIASQRDYTDSRSDYADSIAYRDKVYADSRADAADEKAYRDKVYADEIAYRDKVYNDSRSDYADDIAYRDKVYNDSRSDYADEVAYRDKVYDDSRADVADEKEYRDMVYGDSRKDYETEYADEKKNEARNYILNYIASLGGNPEYLDEDILAKAGFTAEELNTFKDSYQSNTTTSSGSFNKSLLDEFQNLETATPEYAEAILNSLIKYGVLENEDQISELYEKYVENNDGRTATPDEVINAIGEKFDKYLSMKKGTNYLQSKIDDGTITQDDADYIIDMFTNRNQSKRIANKGLNNWQGD